MIRNTKHFLKSTPLLAFAVLVLNGCNSNSVPDNEQSEPLAIGAATSADFVAVRVEAENYNDLTGGWTLTSQDNIPAITPDPDPPHHSSASNGAYVELLPDTRVTHDDVLRNGENFWGTPGDGPRLEYNVNIPEAGKYFVYVKAYSTGPEDNGIHVGINDNTPLSGYRIQLCSGKNKWTWSSAQRVDTNHCGVTKTIFLDIETAGSHKITFYAREDGFELDQFLLLKDVNPETRDCFPITSDKIRCVDVATGDTIGNYILDTTPTDDGNEVTPAPAPTTAVVDLQLRLSANKESVVVTDEIEYTLTIDNTDDADTATNVVALVSLPSGLDFVSSDLCTSDDAQVICDFSEVTADERVTASFTVVATAASTLRIDAQVSTDIKETEQGNNTDSEQLTISERIPDYDGALTLLQGPNALGLNSSTTHLISITNKGQLEINDATLSINRNAAISVASDHPGCIVDTAVTCSLSGVLPGDSLSIPLTIDGVTPGQGNISVQLVVPSDEDTDNNALNTSVFVIDNTISTDTNGIVTIEAENYTEQATPNSAPLENAYNSAWFVVSEAMNPAISPDFDSVTAASTSNSSYIEFLPDTRVGNDDPVVLNVSNYTAGGESSVVTYRAFFNEPGRYFVAGLLRANNAQDASIHVGFNNTWPASAADLTVCAPNGQWQWSHSVQCGTDNNAYIDVTNPGIHSIHVSAATDGVELDKISLSLEDTTLPDGLGEESVAYIEPDIDLSISNQISSGSYRVSVLNPDTTAAAVDITVQLSGIDVTLASDITGFDGCEANADRIDCTVNFVAANSERTASINVNSETTITATLISDSDSNSENNFVSTVVESGGGLLDLKLIIALLGLAYLRLQTLTRCIRQS